MRRLSTIILLLTLFTISAFAQNRDRSKEKTIKVATTLNYYSAQEPYKFPHEYTVTRSNLILNFITANQGRFMIGDPEELEVYRELENHFPSQFVNIGASVQVVNGNNLFHEISLTRFSISKSAFIENFWFRDTIGDQQRISFGYEQKSAAFGFRYEFGKYFGHRKSKVHFGLSGSFEPSLFFYKWDPKTSQDFPIKGAIFNFEMAVIPSLSAKLSKKLTLDLKVIPNILIADFESIRELNPEFTETQQLENDFREYELPEFNVAFSVLLRYQIKEPRRRGR